MESAESVRSRVEAVRVMQRYVLPLESRCALVQWQLANLLKTLQYKERISEEHVTSWGDP